MDFLHTFVANCVSYEAQLRAILLQFTLSLNVYIINLPSLGQDLRNGLKTPEWKYIHQLGRMLANCWLAHMTSLHSSLRRFDSLVLVR